MEVIFPAVTTRSQPSRDSFIDCTDGMAELVSYMISFFKSNSCNLNIRSSSTYVKTLQNKYNSSYFPNSSF